jgi:hypothetical protein
MPNNGAPTLLWGMDTETGKIAALPASPLLLPALLFIGALKIASILLRSKVKKKELPTGFNEQEYLKNKKEHDAYIYKIHSGIQLTDHELMRLNTVLPFPSWSNGERWHY